MTALTSVPRTPPFYLGNHSCRLSSKDVKESRAQEAMPPLCPLQSFSGMSARGPQEGLYQTTGMLFGSSNGTKPPPSYQTFVGDTILSIFFCSEFYVHGQVKFINEEELSQSLERWLSG